MTAHLDVDTQCGSVCDMTLNLMISEAGWMCAEKMSPHIPKPSGKYHITHLLYRHLPSVYLRGLQLDNGLQWDKGVFMK